MVNGDGDSRSRREVIIVPIVALIWIGLVIYWSISEHHSKRAATS